MGDPVSAVTAGIASVANMFDNKREEGHRIATDAAAEQQRQIEELTDRQKKEETNSIDAALRARRRIASRASRANYSRGTILTSPIGVIGEPQTANKTLLGS